MFTLSASDLRFTGKAPFTGRPAVAMLLTRPEVSLESLPPAIRNRHEISNVPCGTYT